MLLFSCADPQVGTPDEGSNLAPNSAKEQRAAEQVVKKLDTKIEKLQVTIETWEKDLAKTSKAEQLQRQKLAASDIKGNALQVKLTDKEKEIAAKEKRIDRLEGLVVNAGNHAPASPMPVNTSALWLLSFAALPMCSVAARVRSWWRSSRIWTMRTTTCSRRCASRSRARVGEPRVVSRCAGSKRVGARQAGS